MKIEFGKKVIETALAKTIKAASVRSPLPILSYVLIRTEKGGKVSFSTTDLEFGIECRVEANILEEGSVCVPARIITDLVGQIMEDRVTLEYGGEGSLELTTVKSKYHINTRDVEEFPILPKPSDNMIFSMPQGTLKEMLRNVIIAVAGMEEQRVALTGVHVTADESGVMTVSTDSRRLVKAVEPLDEPPSGEFSVIIPQRSIKEILGLLSEEETPVHFTLSEGQVFLSFDHTNIFSRIIDGKFPNYEVVIPRSTDIKVLVERARLQNAVKRALIMASDKDSPDLMRMEISRDSLKLMANSVDMGDAYEEVSVQEFEGNPIALAVNGKYFMEALNVMTDDFIWVLLNSPVMPVMLNSPRRDSYIYIVMPVRLRKDNIDTEASVHSYS